MPNLNGLEAARRIRKEFPKTEILIPSLHSSDQAIREVVEMGAKGYIIKSDSNRNLFIAVQTIADHKPFLTSCAADLKIQSSMERSIWKRVVIWKPCSEF